VIQALIQECISADRQWHLVAHPHWPWRDLPEKYGKWMTVYQRFRRWSEAGIWEAVATTLARAMADNLPPTAWIRRRFAIMSRLPGQKGDSRTSFWPFARRVHL